MKVLTFQARFAPMVEAGKKTRTIRKRRKHPIISGEPLSLREWTGRPYASKQRILRVVKRCEAEGIIIHPDGVEISPGTLRAYFMGEKMRGQLLEIFAREDGFADWADMKAWFTKTHGLPFEGVLISWDAA